MAYNVKLTKRAESDFDLVMKSYPRSVKIKLMDIITNELVNNPRSGKYRVEHHKGVDEWTRELTKKDRVRYRIEDQDVIVEVIQCLGHNNDK